MGTFTPTERIQEIDTAHRGESTNEKAATMSGHITVGSSGWTIADRVATAVLTTTQCAIFLVVMIVVPSSRLTLDPTVVGATLVGSGVVAIGGPIVIVVTIGFACRAFYRDRMSFSIPLAGVLVLVAMYVFPIILVTAMRT